MPRKPPPSHTRTFTIGNMVLQVTAKGAVFEWTQTERERVARIVDFLNQEEITAAAAKTGAPHAAKEEDADRPAR
jgi:Asp-tRNA(Asn)/Glu-tRNA(Gln) amidotransferase B subunit